MAAIPTILKGDDSGIISLTMATGRSYTGATLVVAYQGVTRSLTGLTPGQVVALSFTHDETSKFTPGCKPLLMRLIGPTGSEETVENSEARIKVTEVLSEVNAGGSFIVRPGDQTAEKVPVTDLGDMPSRYTLSQLQEKVNQIVRVLAQRSLLSLLLSACCLSASSDVTVQTARLDSIHNDDIIVTSVTGGGPAISTNEVAGIVSNTVTKTYVEALGLSETDPTVPSWAKSETPPVMTETDPNVPSWAKSATPPATSLEPATNYTDGCIEALPEWSKSPEKPSYTVSEISGAATHGQVLGIMSVVSAWSSYWSGEDVRVTVTNYDSLVNLPCLAIEYRTNETVQATNHFRTVWREMAHWDCFLGTNWNWRAPWVGFGPWADAVEEAIDEKADRAWGFYDSSTGRYAPEGHTSVSSSNVLISAGTSYQKTVTTASEVWVLTANEPYTTTGVSSNGHFQIKDSDGNVQLEIVRGDKITVAAQAHATAFTNTTLYVTYNIVNESHPNLDICLDLRSADWKSETDQDCPATVTWSGSSGAYVAQITPKSATNLCFVKASYQRQGEHFIRSGAHFHVNGVEGRTYDFSQMSGVYSAVKDIVTALGGTVTNYPSFQQ